MIESILGFCASKHTLWVIFAIYLGQTVGYLKENNPGMALVMTSYAVSLIGFVMTRG